jgi:hypothetical protein
VCMRKGLTTSTGIGKVFSATASESIPYLCFKRFGLPMSRLEIFKVMGCYVLLRGRLARGRIVLH